jgi:hypothetical protein
MANYHVMITIQTINTTHGFLELLHDSEQDTYVVKLNDKTLTYDASQKEVRGFFNGVVFALNILNIQ